MSNKNITLKELNDAFLYWKKNVLKHQRLGQFLINYFELENSKIFFEEEPNVAYNMFLKNI